jgi:hypothetical protein
MSREKHTSYFNMLDALRDATRCPLCLMEAKALHSYFDSVLYENVNDPNVRAALGRSKGYCCRHAEKLVAFRDGLGTAMLYQDVVRDLHGSLGALGKGGKVVRSRYRVWVDHADCPACRVQQEARARYAGTLLDGLSQDELRAAFESCPGLCVPHLLFILDGIAGQETRSYLVRIHQAKYGALLRELEEFCRKHNYVHKNERMGKEGDSWERAVRMIVGRDS